MSKIPYTKQEVASMERCMSGNEISSSGAIIVAAADTPGRLKASADFVCDGTADETQINAALAAAYLTGQTTTNVRTTAGEDTPITVTNAGGCVHLLPGSYILADEIALASYKYQMTLQGSGPSTIIQQAAGKHVITACYSRSAEGDGLQLRDFRIEGNSAGYHGFFTANCHRMRLHNVQVFRVGLDSLATLAADINIYEDDSDLISPWSWVASGEGTGEYYLVYFASKNSGKGIDWRAGEPASASLEGGGNQAKSGTLGLLSAGNWQYGDNDSIGYNTIYVRLSDDSKPDPGDVVINDYSPASNNHVSDCAFQWAGRMGNRWIGNHETLITNCHYEGNSYGGLYHERTFNFKISNCSIEDTLNSKPGYKSVEVNDSILTGVVCEDDAEISAADASFDQFAGVSITGNLTITTPFTAGNNGGNYSFTSSRINGVVSTGGSGEVGRLVFAGCPGVTTLGNITCETFEASACTFDPSGDVSIMTIKEETATNGNSSQCIFSGCHWKANGTDNDVYTFQGGNEDAQQFSFSGGTARGMTLTFTDGSASDLRVAFGGGWNGRTSNISCTDIAYLSIVGCQIHDGNITTDSNTDNVAICSNVLDGTTISIGDCDQAFAFVGNLCEGASITIESSCNGDGTFVGNVDTRFSTASTFTDSGAGTTVNANNQGVGL